MLTLLFIFTSLSVSLAGGWSLLLHSGRPLSLLYQYITGPKIICTLRSEHADFRFFVPETQKLD